jgi:hypothetical protein
MPIIEPTRNTAPVFFPESDYKIVKYLDLTKFVSLLQNRSLFFCRLDKLEDKFEGTTTRPNRELRIKTHHHLRDSGFFKIPLSDEDIIQSVDEQYEFERNLKGITCVNCWNKKNNESTALWKIYSNFTNGIMLKSSISKLKKALEVAPEEIQLTEINYLDYSKDYMPDGNSNYPLIHKHIAYSYEDEVRLIYTKMPELGWVYDWSKEEVQEGLYIKTDLTDLIDEIIISPYSSNWFFKLVKDISDKYDLNKPVVKSELTID